MVPQEKEALVALSFSIAFALLILPLKLLLPALASDAVFLSLLAFVLVLWIGRKAIGLKAKAMDERDRAIRYQAGLVGSHVLGIVTMVGAVILCMPQRTTAAVPTLQIALLVYYAWLMMYFAWSLTVLVLYRKGGLR